MSPKFTNQQKAERAERAREIIKDFMHCETRAEFNEMAELHKNDIKSLGLRRGIRKCMVSSFRRIQAKEISQSFNYQN